jgi:2-C-methyl-D-erythritol 4-phosphate cytidylyltransferase
MEDERCRSIVLVTEDAHIEKTRQVCKKHNFVKVTEIINGGMNRIASVQLALKHFTKSDDLLAVHTITYPFVTLKELHNLYFAALDNDGAVLGCPLEDSIKNVSETLQIVDTETRKKRWITHAPTIAHANIWQKAYKSVQPTSDHPTDEAAILSRAGFTIQVVPDLRSNFPIYTTFDWERMCALHKNL